MNTTVKQLVIPCDLHYVMKNHSKDQAFYFKGQTFAYIPCVTEDQAPLIFRHPCESYLGGEREYRLWNDKFYHRIPCSSIQEDKTGWCSIDAIKEYIKNFAKQCANIDVDQNTALEKLRKETEKFIIFNQTEVWACIEKPRYEIVSFGPGNNRGQTVLSITNKQNANIPMQHYFDADSYEEAVEKCIQVAKNRGDTKSISHIKESIKIEILTH